MLFRFSILFCLAMLGLDGHAVFFAPQAIVTPKRVSPTPTPTPRPDQTSWVEGRVFDARTHKPLAKAKVSYEGGIDDLFETRTDANGRYRIDHVAPGGYAYSAEAAGYSSRSNYGWRGTADSAELHISPKGLKFDIGMVPAGKLSGQVRDIVGRPVAEAKVRVYPVNGEVNGFGDTHTDKNGRFSVSELEVLHPHPDALYAVEVTNSQLSIGTTQVRVRPFYSANDEAHVALTMKPRAVVSGRLVFRGRPPVNGLVSLNQVEGGDSSENTAIATDKHGRFSLRVSAPATYSALIYGEDTEYLTVPIRVQPGRNSVVNRTLKPFPYGSLRGRIVNLQGHPVKGAAIELWTRDTSETEPVAYTDRKGCFFAPKVAPRDDYTVSVTMPNGAFRGGVDLEHVSVRSYRTTSVSLVGDTIPPKLEILDAPRILNGIVIIRFKASDNQGLRSASPYFDGTWMTDDKEFLGFEFDEKKPARQATGTFRWNARNATNGRHRLRVVVNDLVGNTAAREWLVWVQGSPKPAPKRQSFPAPGTSEDWAGTATNAAADFGNEAPGY